VSAGLPSKGRQENQGGRVQCSGVEGNFADVRFDPAPDWKAADKITAAWSAAGSARPVRCHNIVRQSGDPRGMSGCSLIENWKRLGSNNISTETGSLNPQSEWNDSPENATEAAYQQCRGSLERFARMAEKTGAVISIEAYWKNVIGSVERTERLFRDIPSPALKLVMDPCNFYRKADLANMQAMLNDMFQRVGKQTVLAHAKDVKGAANADDTELPYAGQGVLDYPLYLRLLAQLDREIYLAVEHLTLPDVPAARDYVLPSSRRSDRPVGQPRGCPS
jgi:sugar phosphate isomerase/epimerase